MSVIHFLNVLEGDCNIIQHDSGRITVMDVSNAYNEEDTAEEKRVKQIKEREIKTRNFVPDGKVNYRQKEFPDNPIEYIKERIAPSSIFRFIISHPDMDHLDGIKDFYDEFRVINTWDTDNQKQLDDRNFPYRYNGADWKFYTDIRDGKYGGTNRLTYLAGARNEFYTNDYLTILSPTHALVNSANAQNGDIHDLSYVLLYTPPKKGGGRWKFLFAGDSHDNSWNHILNTYKSEVTNVDVLFAPHHGRDSERSYDFLKILNPQVTLMGNASSEHLAYERYPEIRITNNMAGHVIIDVSEERLQFFCKNKEFAGNFINNPKRRSGSGILNPSYDRNIGGWKLGEIDFSQ